MSEKLEALLDEVAEVRDMLNGPLSSSDKHAALTKLNGVLRDGASLTVPPSPDSGMVEAAKEAVSAFAKEQPEAEGAPSPDDSEYGFEWNFSDGSTLWFDIEPDHPGGCGFGVYWRRGDQKAGGGKESHHLRALSTASQPQPERRALAGASRLQAIIAELKSFPPSPLIEDAIDSLERIS